MEHYILPLVSGFVGAILGAFVALGINSANRRIAATEKMLSLVYLIGFRSWSNPDEGRPGMIFHENYSELWNASAALRAALPWRKQKGSIRLGRST